MVLVILFHRDSIKSRDREVSNRQKEIDRLANENHEYRDRFTNILNLETDSKYKDE